MYQSINDLQTTDTVSNDEESVNHQSELENSIQAEIDEKVLLAQKLRHKNRRNH